MIDFLRANTWCTVEQYKWSMTVAQINLASCDYSRIEYDKKKDSDTAYIESVEDLKGLTDFGAPIITPKNKDNGKR